MCHPHVLLSVHLTDVCSAVAGYHPGFGAAIHCVVAIKQVELTCLGSNLDSHCLYILVSSLKYKGNHNIYFLGVLMLRQRMHQSPTPVPGRLGKYSVWVAIISIFSSPLTSFFSFCHISVFLYRFLSPHVVYKCMLVSHILLNVPNSI